MHQSCTMFPLLLLALAPLLEGALPGFIQDEEGGGRECDGSMCWWTTFHMHYHTDKQVVNSSLVVAGQAWEWVELRLAGLLETCAPGLPLNQIAYKFSACEELKEEDSWSGPSEAEVSCTAYSRGWIGSNGEIDAAFLKGTLGGLARAEGYVEECLAWEGGDYFYHEEYYDYYDYDDYYDYYDRMEEGGEVESARSKRSISDSLGKRMEKRQGRREEKGGLKKKRVKGGKKNHGGAKKHTMSNKSERGLKRNNKSSMNKKKKNTKKNKQGKKAKVQARKISDKKKEKERKKDIKKLRKIGLKAVASEKVLDQVKCISYAVDLALEKCAQEALKDTNLS